MSAVHRRNSSFVSCLSRALTYLIFIASAWRSCGEFTQGLLRFLVGAHDKVHRIFAFRLLCYALVTVNKSNRQDAGQIVSQKYAGLHFPVGQLVYSGFMSQLSSKITHALLHCCINDPVFVGSLWCKLAPRLRALVLPYWPIEGATETGSSPPTSR